MMITRRTLCCDEKGCPMQLDGTPGQKAEDLRAAARRDGWYAGTHGAALCPTDAMKYGVGKKGDDRG